MINLLAASVHVASATCQLSVTLQGLQVFKADPDDEEALEKLKNLRPKPRRKIGRLCS